MTYYNQFLRNQKEHGYNIFISYKYADDKVYKLDDKYTNGDNTIARHYVNKLEEYIKEYSVHKYYAETDDNDLSKFKDDTIKSKLRDKIFRSSLTIVLISKGMKDNNQKESDQWIPWEISYSLKNTTRDDTTSGSNAILAVVLPDENNSYCYFLEEDSKCNSRYLKTSILFEILRNNMFNIKDEYVEKKECDICKEVHYLGEPSYIYAIDWNSFIHNPESYINKAKRINENIDRYNIQKEITK